MAKPKEKKTLKKIISDVVFGIIMAFLGLVVIFVIVERTTGFSIGGQHVLWVKTNSMEPTIPSSSYILVKDAKADEIAVDDIVTFVSEDPTIKGELNTHRIIEETTDGYYITKGDNNIAQDAYKISVENIKYKYEKNLPVLSLFGNLFSSTIGYVLTVVGVIGLTAVWFTIDAKNSKKEKKEELMNKLIEEEVKRLEEESKSSK